MYPNFSLELSPNHPKEFVNNTKRAQKMTSQAIIPVRINFRRYVNFFLVIVFENEVVCRPNEQR